MKVQDILYKEMFEINIEKLDSLKKSLTDRPPAKEWVLCLGAGVSISAGLPDWYGLLARMTAQIMPTPISFELQNNTDVGQISASAFGKNTSEKENYIEDYMAFKSDMKSNLAILAKDKKYLKMAEAAQNGEYKYVFQNINVLESAEYIRNYLAHQLTPQTGADISKESTEKNITWHINYYIQQSCIRGLKYSIESDEMKKSALGAVARFLKSGKDSLIHDVITYNFDNLLEEYLRKNCACTGESIHSVIKTDPLPQFGDKNAWNIYHVHGRIPVFECESEKMSAEVILTESDYYKEERINYSWSNTIQSYIFGRANMIFIGFSGTDYNFRRLLKYINRDRNEFHERYIFFSVDDIVNAVFDRELQDGHSISECIQMMNMDDSQYAYEKLMINYLIHARTIYWLKYGIKVIWTSHEELPENLDNLHL